MRWLALLLISGCTPYVGYTHLSLPNIADGFDLVCAGLETDKGRISTDLAACENVRTWGNTGTYVKADIRVRLGKN